jgi:hypothetical protein
VPEKREVTEQGRKSWKVVLGLDEMEICRYFEADGARLYDLIRSEGDEWRGYWGQWTAYVRAMDRSEVFVAVDGAKVCATPAASRTRGSGSM